LLGAKENSSQYASDISAEGKKINPKKIFNQFEISN
jgi:hypothetical protein